MLMEDQMSFRVLRNKDIPESYGKGSMIRDHAQPLFLDIA